MASQINSGLFNFCYVRSVICQFGTSPIIPTAIALIKSTYTTTHYQNGTNDFYDKLLVFAEITFANTFQDKNESKDHYKRNYVMKNYCSHFCMCALLFLTNYNLSLDAF